MKKLSLFLMTLAAVFVFAACGSKAAKDPSPKDVAVQWFQALLDGDLKTANELSTEQTKAFNGLMASAMQANDKEDKEADDDDPKAMLEQLKKAEEKIEGDTATLIVDGKEGFTLKKVDGKWKVDLQKD